MYLFVNVWYIGEGIADIWVGWEGIGVGQVSGGKALPSPL